MLKILLSSEVPVKVYKRTYKDLYPIVPNPPAVYFNSYSINDQYKVQRYSSNSIIG